jgi:hypothetical protein
MNQTRIESVVNERDCLFMNFKIPNTIARDYMEISGLSFRVLRRRHKTDEARGD